MACTSFTHLYTFAGISEKKICSIVLMLLALSSTSISAAVLFKFPLLLGIPAAAIYVFYTTLRSRKSKRVADFDKDYTALLVSLASSIRTGLDPLQALLQADRLFDESSVVRDEIAKLNTSLQQGTAEEKVIIAFANTIDHPDVHLFRAAFVLARQEGSSLGQCLERLTRVTRQRQSFRRKSKAAVAMQKLSAYGISACALIITLFQIITNADATLAAYHHPTGGILFGIGATLMLMGLYWMNRLCRMSL